MALIVPKLPEMVQKIVATPSVSSTVPQFDQSNRPMVDLLASWLEPLGFDVQISSIEGYPGKVNLIQYRLTPTSGSQTHLKSNKTVIAGMGLGFVT
jgi:acetylornithine deacetylase